ncbi:MAG: hypothetical protein OER80_09945 [Gammaproteobacteria bacterium]|nr:hypothetical protein [Gammaproteobacteria bacterium]
MMRNIAIILLLTLAVAGCSKKDNLDEAAERMAQDAREKVDKIIPDDPPQNLEDALKKVGDALADGDQSVSAADLKELLPEEMIGLKRTSHSAERAGFGIKVSKANASYGDGEERMNLMITDLGGASGLAKMGRELFETEVDREDENGFERTTTYKGHKSFQRLQKSGDQSIGEIMIFVDDRFTIQLDAQNVSFEQMLQGAGEIDLDALSEMAVAAKQ